MNSKYNSSDSFWKKLEKPNLSLIILLENKAQMPIILLAIKFCPNHCKLENWLLTPLPVMGRGIF